MTVEKKAVLGQAVMNDVDSISKSVPHLMLILRKLERMPAVLLVA